MDTLSYILAKQKIEENVTGVEEEVTELKSAINAMGLCVYNSQFYINPNGNEPYAV